jgi:pimeloyl-ACP methyl ester carboxylesterase
MSVDSVVAVHRYPHLAPRGTAVLLPGFLDDGRSPGVATLAHALPGIGFTGIAVDPRGTGDSPGVPADCAPSVQLADIRTVLDRHAHNTHTVLVGHCYGGLLAGLTAARDTRVTDLVMVAPTRCFIWSTDYDPERDTWRADGVRTFIRADPATGTLRTLRIPHTVVGDAARYSLPGALRSVSQRVLFVAGLYDGVVPVDSVRQLHDECASPARTFVALPVEHDYRDHPEQLALVNRTVLDWIAASPG